AVWSIDSLRGAAPISAGVCLPSEALDLAKQRARGLRQLVDDGEMVGAGYDEALRLQAGPRPGFRDRPTLPQELRALVAADGRHQRSVLGRGWPRQGARCTRRLVIEANEIVDAGGDERGQIEHAA